MRLMKIKNLTLGLALALAAFAQSSTLGAIAAFNRAEAALDNQQKQAAIGAAQAPAEEAHLRAEDIQLQTLGGSQKAQQRVGEGKASADLENQAKALDAQSAAARHQVRIDHLSVLAVKAKEKHPDFDETVSHLTLPASHAMLEAILDSELGAEIMYWLGKHPTDCKLIGDLPPVSAVREIGRIEGTIAPLRD
jgi:hypothetical protein